MCIQYVLNCSCPDPTILSPFDYNSIRGVAEADLFSMFKFPDSNRVHFQCDIVVCQGPCEQPECDETLPEAPRRQSSFRDPRIDLTAVASEEGGGGASSRGNEEGALMASYSVFVLEPGEKIGRQTLPHPRPSTASPSRYTFQTLSVLFCDRPSCFNFNLRFDF